MSSEFFISCLLLPVFLSINSQKQAHTEMAEVMAKKPLHPPFPRMICDAMHEHPMPMSMQSLKKWLPEHYKVC